MTARFEKRRRLRPAEVELPSETIRSLQMRLASMPTEPIEMSGSTEASAVRFGPLPFSAMRRVRRVLTDPARSGWTIAQGCGSSMERTSAILTKLVRAGWALQADAGYVGNGTAMPVPRDEAVPRELGRQILLCLFKPRRTKDIARIIDRPPSNTTGQLRHLLRRSLVVGVSKGVYDLARPDGRQAPEPDPAMPLRPATGVSLPTGMATSMAATHAVRGA